jgi:hypothetical protein
MLRHQQHRPPRHPHSSSFPVCSPRTANNSSLVPESQPVPRPSRRVCNASVCLSNTLMSTGADAGFALGCQRSKAPHGQQQCCNLCSSATFCLTLVSPAAVCCCSRGVRPYGSHHERSAGRLLLARPAQAAAAAGGQRCRPEGPRKSEVSSSRPLQQHDAPACWPRRLISHLLLLCVVLGISCLCWTSTTGCW